MVKITVVPRADAQRTRARKAPGVRRQRQHEFDLYVQELLDNPGHAVVFEELGEPAQKFTFALRGALRRAGKDAVVRKQRGRDEVRVWLVESPGGTANPAGPPNSAEEAMAMALPGEDAGALVEEEPARPARRRQRRS